MNSSCFIVQTNHKLPKSAHIRVLSHSASSSKCSPRRFWMPYTIQSRHDLVWPCVISHQRIVLKYDIYSKRSLDVLEGRNAPILFVNLKIVYVYLSILLQLCNPFGSSADYVFRMCARLERGGIWRTHRTQSALILDIRRRTLVYEVCAPIYLMETKISCVRKCQICHKARDSLNIQLMLKKDKCLVSLQTPKRRTGPGCWKEMLSLTWR
jgi:hypothetical protein